MVNAMIPSIMQCVIVMMQIMTKTFTQVLSGIAAVDRVTMSKMIITIGKTKLPNADTQPRFVYLKSDSRRTFTKL